MAQPGIKRQQRRVRRAEDLDRVGILAIEGMLAMLGTLSGILRSFRFNAVNVLGNSEEAWTRLTTEPRLKPDLILIDWNSHPMNGESFVKQLRRVDTPVAETPVIAIIANADRAVVFAARDSGVNAVLLRPFSAAQLMEKILWTMAQDDTPFIRAEGYVGPDRRRFRTSEYLGEKRRVGETNDRPADEAV